MPPERPSLDFSNFPKAKERDMSFGDMSEEIPMVEEESLQADMGGDACCINAKNKWIEGLRDLFGEPSEGNNEIYQMYEEMSCEEFRDAIEQFAGGRPGVLYDRNVGMGRARPTSEHYLAKRILEEWDMCEAKSTFGDDMEFYASEDAFEAAWDHLAKGFQDLIDQGEVHLHGTRFMDPNGFDDDTDTALIDYALGKRGRYGDERFKYNIMLPTDLALDTLGKPTGIKNRMRASQDGHWRRRKEKFDEAVDSMMMAFGAGGWDRGGGPELPFYPMTIGARLGGRSGLPNESKNISQRETYANYRDQMLPVVQQALESTTDKLVPVAGSMINSLGRPNISLGVVPGFEGNDLGMAAKLLAMQDVGGLSGGATPEAMSMNRKMARHLGPRAESLVNPKRQFAEFKLKDTEPLVTGNMDSTKDIKQLARTITSNPDYFKDEENAPWLQAFGERWQA